LSADAYNLGVRATVQSAGAEAEEEEEDIDGHATIDAGNFQRPDVVTSSSRKRINAWLPLYLNRAHWNVARTFAPSAFSLIATQMNSAFQPKDALQVCARLLCCAVVGFVHPGKEPRDQSRACASEAAVQMYCDVHRLFHEMAETFPDIRTAALAEVHEFLADPEKRTRRGTPNLGDLISYLSIIDEIGWEELAPVFVPEMVRRACTRLCEPLDAAQCGTPDEIIERFDALDPDHGLVILFNKVFNMEVARPLCAWDSECYKTDATSCRLSCSEVRDLYDRRWGQLPKSKRTALLLELARIRNLGSVRHVLRELLPFEFDDASVCELILWANSNAANRKAIHTVPNVRNMSFGFTAEWRRAAELRREMALQVRALLDAGSSPEDTLKGLFQKATELDNRTKDPGERPKYHHASKETACAVAKAQREGAQKASEKEAKRSAKLEELSTRPAADAFGGKAKGRGKSKDHVLTLSDWWENRELKDLVVRKPEPFEIRIVQDPESCFLTSTNTELTVRTSYLSDSGEMTTVRHLRHLIAAKASLEEREEGKMRLVLEEREGTPLAVTAPLAKYQLHANPTVRVVPHKRGGIKPGRGWFQSKSTAAPKAGLVAGIAAGIVRETTFARASQHFLRIDSDHRYQFLADYVTVVAKDTVVLCNAGSLGALKQWLSKNSPAMPTEALNVMKINDAHLVLVAEGELMPAEEKSGPLFTFNRALGRFEPADSLELPEVITALPEGATADAECSKQYGVTVPPEASSAEIIVVFDALHEAASLTEVLKHARQKDIQVLHVVHNGVSIVLETEEERKLLKKSLDAQGCLRGELLVRDQRVPPGALVSSRESSESLPEAVDFRLRMQAMGFVIRLQQRFGCQVAQVCDKAMRIALEAAR